MICGDLHLPQYFVSAFEVGLELWHVKVRAFLRDHIFERHAGLYKLQPVIRQSYFVLKMAQSVRATLDRTLQLAIVQFRVVQADPSTLLFDLLMKLSVRFLYFLEGLLRR